MRTTTEVSEPMKEFPEFFLHIRQLEHHKAKLAEHAEWIIPLENGYLMRDKLQQIIANFNGNGTLTRFVSEDSKAEYVAVEYRMVHGKPRAYGVTTAFFFTVKTL